MGDVDRAQEEQVRAILAYIKASAEHHRRRVIAITVAYALFLLTLTALAVYLMFKVGG